MAIADLSCHGIPRQLFLAALFASLCIARDTGRSGSCSRQQQEDARVVASLIMIKYPPDGAVISDYDYRGGGKGHEMGVDFEVEHLPCGAKAQLE